MPIVDEKIFGKFKKILISESALLAEAERLRNNLEDLRTHFQILENSNVSESSCNGICFESKLSTQAEIGFAFFKIFLKSRYANLQKDHLLSLLDTLDTVQLLDSELLFAVPLSVRTTLKNWILGVWDLRLIDYCPTSLEMASAQASGFRYVTCDFDAAVTGSLVEGERDAFEHFLHDLAHAYTFFLESYESSKQKEFFQMLVQDYPLFETFSKQDPIFSKKFSYCLADMNSHPMHLKFFLKAITREYFLKLESKCDGDKLSIEGQKQLEEFYSRTRTLKEI